MWFVVLAAVMVRYYHHRKLADPFCCVLYSSGCFVCSRITFYLSSLYNCKASRPLNSRTYSVRKFADYKSTDISDLEYHLLPFLAVRSQMLDTRLSEGDYLHMRIHTQHGECISHSGEKKTIMDEHN